MDDETRSAAVSNNGGKNHKTSAAGSQLEVREMVLEDLAAVFALGERLFTAERWPNLYRTWDEYEVVGFFQSDGETCFVAELDGEVVGFVLGTLIEKRRSAWIYGYLVWIGVDAQAGRRGVGSRLLRRLNEKFIELGARIVLVDTDATNDAAIRFFEREGFGHRMEHVYMSANLTQRPDYQKIRQRVLVPARRTTTAAVNGTTQPPHHTTGGRRRRPGGGSFVRNGNDTLPESPSSSASNSADLAALETDTEPGQEP